jgi:23S rRNA (cytidine1920-2'-O)/16S rRNA (cytidine1409-2'-O)-methyltransferase
MPKTRLDLLLVERGLAESRSLAQRLIMAGQVRVDGQLVLKPATGVASEAELTLDYGPRYVSRGGEKLQGALEAFPLTVQGRTCADVGASTGGFTDCLLQRGAAKVYAIDVGYGQLSWKIRSDPRVVVMDRTNARYLDTLPEPIDVAVVDASFISLRLILPSVLKWLTVDAHVVTLIKPQFEAGRERVGKGGVVRDTTVRADVIRSIWQVATALGFRPIDLIRSPIAGPAGNIEFLMWLRAAASHSIEPSRSIDDLVSVVVAENV